MRSASCAGLLLPNAEPAPNILLPPHAEETELLLVLLFPPHNPFAFCVGLVSELLYGPLFGLLKPTCGGVDGAAGRVALSPAVGGCSVGKLMDVYNDTICIK